LKEKGKKEGTFSSQAEQRAASSAAQKRMAAALSQTSQMVRIIYSVSMLFDPSSSIVLQFLKTSHHLNFLTASLTILLIC